MPEIIIAEHHDQVYPVWVERGMRGVKLTHVDFHCDMRGILIDRTKNSAIFTSHRETTFVDRGNFLAHAIMNGIVTDLRWIHDQHGGRAFDIGPTVSYETDFLAPWFRLKHALSDRTEKEFVYEETLMSSWEGPRAGEQLDIDWDGLASVEYSKSTREKLVSQFLAKDFTHIPEITFLVYSPGYSDPDKSLFEDFAKALSQKFQAELVRLPVTELNTEGEQFGYIKRAIPQPVKDIKRELMRRIRHAQAADDLKTA